MSEKTKQKINKTKMSQIQNLLQFTEILQTIRKYFKHSNFMLVFYLNKMESWETKKAIINYQRCQPAWPFLLLTVKLKKFSTI